MKNTSYCMLLILILLSGLIKPQRKKGLSVKEGKKMHSHIQSSQTQIGILSQPAVLQSSSQMKQQHLHQPSPAGFMVPPVAALESSQLLESSFESLPPFGQPLMHLSHHTGNPSSPPHLSAQSAGQGSPETHPFLNQHPVLPSPGKATCRLLSTYDYFVFCCFCRCN